jgi:hypothetical protein
MRKFLSVAFGAAVVLGAAPALAQETFGKQGHLAIGADRLFGIHFTHLEVENPGPGDDFEYDQTGFGLGWRGRGARSPFDQARLAIDYFVIDSLSIGGSIAYASYNDDDDDDDDEDDHSDFLFSPRVGYVIMFTDLFGFWPRGGFTYHSRSQDDDAFVEDDENGFAFTAEAMFVWTPVDHLGFSFGPTLDWDLTGERETPGQDVDQNWRSIALLNIGVFGYIPL